MQHHLCLDTTHLSIISSNIIKRTVHTTCKVFLVTFFSPNFDPRLAHKLHPLVSFSWNRCDGE